jgi:hypothetical protein
MDVGTFVQENKRWLIGCAVGGVVYLIGYLVVTSLYDKGAEGSKAVALWKSGKNAELYQKASLDAAREEAEQLQQERQRLQNELAFVPTAKFQLAGNGAPEEYLFQVGRTLKQALLDAADERNVQVADKEVGWPAVNGVDEIRGVLFGLELLDEAGKRLFAAHDAVRQQDPDAVGLRAILQLKTDDRRSQRGQVRSVRPGEVDLRDHVVQERVLFQFQADAPTVLAFFEACRKPGRTLTLESVQIQQPQTAGEPVLVKGSLQGIAFKEAR